MFFSAIYSAAALVILGGCATSFENFTPSKQKRQIFREQVLPAFGGKIPDDAFRADRLALNRLNALGIAIPDGVLLDHRHTEKHHNSHRQDPDLEASVIKLVQTPDGRYVPPEGQTGPVSHNQVESTYVIRPPVGYKHHLGPQKPRPGTITIPTNQNFPHQNIPSYDNIDNIGNVGNVGNVGSNDNYGYTDVYSFMNKYDVPSFYSKPSMSQVWGGFGVLFPDFLARHLREAKPPPGVHTTGPEGGLISDYTLVTKSDQESTLNQVSPPAAVPVSIQVSNPVSVAVSDYPDLRVMPKTRFVCDRSGRLYADPEAKCQVFHLCHYDGQMESFLCPVGTRFDANLHECNPWQAVTCQSKG